MMHHSLSVVILAVVLAGLAVGGDPKPPLPDEDTRAKSLKVIKEVFAADYASKKPGASRSLAEKLVKQAADTVDDPVARFVLADEAARLAAAAGDQSTLDDALGLVSQEYASDATCAVLTSASRAAATRPVCETVLRRCPAAVAAALADGRLDPAGRLYALATAMLRKAPNKQVEAQLEPYREIPQVRKEFAAIEPALATLGTKSDDPEANLAVGKFLCFRRGNWAEGLPLLANGADEKLKDLAARDTSAPEEATARAAIASEWWVLGEAEKGLTRHHLLRHAVGLYEAAIGELTGLEKVRAEKRLQMVKRITPEEAPVGWDHLNATAATDTKELLRLPPNKTITTKKSYTGPVEITVVARTEKNNIRLCAFKSACVIFNWEGDTRDLRVHRPDGQAGAFGSGSLARAPVQPLQPKIWYKLTWRITNRGMEVLVNGKSVFAEVHANDLTVGGPVMVVAVESVVEVKSVVVKQLR